MDEECLNKVRQEFIPRAKAFNPDLILHNFGHDTGGGDYGDLGLTQDFSPNWPWNSAIEPGRSVGEDTWSRLTEDTASMWRILSSPPFSKFWPLPPDSRPVVSDVLFSPIPIEHRL